MDGTAHFKMEPSDATVLWRVKCIIRFEKNTLILIYFITWINFAFFSKNFYILLMNYQVRVADMFMVMLPSNHSYKKYSFVRMELTSTG